MTKLPVTVPSLASNSGARGKSETLKAGTVTRILPARVAPRLAIRTSCRNTTWPVTSNRLSHRAARASPKQHFVAARIAGRNSRESGRCGGTLPKNTPWVVGLKTEVEEQGSDPEFRIQRETSFALRLICVPDNATETGHVFLVSSACSLNLA